MVSNLSLYIKNIYKDKFIFIYKDKFIYNININININV